MALDLQGEDADLLDPKAVILGDSYDQRGVLTGESAFNLTRLQERLYVYLADLYAPVELNVDDDQSVADATFAPKPTQTAVPCWKTENRNSPEQSPAGRTSAGLSNADVLRFPIEAQVADGWLVKLYPAPVEQLVGAEGDAPGQVPQQTDRPIFYLVQNDPEAHPAIGRRPSNQKKVFALSIPPPRTISGKLLAKRNSNG